MELLNYLLKVSACSALFFAFYLLVLRKLTFFSFNRFYLVVSLFASFLIPTLNFTIEREIQAENFAEVNLATDVQLDNAVFVPQEMAIATPVAEEFDWLGLLPIAYSLVVLMIISISLFKLFQLFKHTKQAVKTNNGLKLVAKAKGFTNCSFFNYVFIDENSLSASELEVLLQHEKVHASQLHSLDKMILLLVKGILWFNPIIYLYDKALEQVHEFEADEKVSTTFGTAPYANLLLKLAISKNEMPLVHNFVKSPIKGRIKMLFNSKSKNMKKLCYLLALPIALTLGWIFGTQIVYAQTVTKQESSANAKNTAVKGRKPTQKELLLPAKTPTNPWFKSEEYLTKSAKAKSLSGKSLTGIIGAEFVPQKNVFILAGRYFKVGNETFILTKDYRDKNSLDVFKENDLVTVDVDGVSFGKEDFMSIIPKTIARDGKILYTRLPLEKYPFLYEANGVRFNDPVITSISNSTDGKELKLAQNGYTFTVKINKSQTDNAGYLQTLKVKDTVRLRFVHEVKSGSNAYIIKDWLSISKNIMSFGLQNEALFYRFYNRDGSQKIKVAKQSAAPSENEKASLKSVLPRIVRSSAAKVDAKNEISYLKDAVIYIDDVSLSAKEATYDQKNLTIVAKKASITKKGEMIVSDEITIDVKSNRFITKENGKIYTLDNFVAVKPLHPGNIEYTAMDSIINNKKTGVMSLYGQATISKNNIRFSGSKIVYDSKANTAFITDASYGDNDAVFTAKTMSVDLNTLKVKTTGVLKGTTKTSY